MNEALLLEAIDIAINSLEYDGETGKVQDLAAIRKFISESTLYVKLDDIK
jgi:hypothetical protein